MSGAPLVLDAAGLDGVAAPRPSDMVRALLAEAHLRGRDVLAPTVVCAELARGPKRTRSLEAAVARHDRHRGEQPPIRLVDTDFALARQVGAILHAARSGSDRIVDAHVVAICIPAGGGLVVSSDRDDILALAATVPAARIRVVAPT